ncbi:MAG: hypothetical protein ACHQ06_06910 [Candidatus Dormibacteria bacterium]
MLLLPVHRGVVLDLVHLLVRHSSDSHGHLGWCACGRSEEEAMVRCNIAVVAANRQPEMMRTDMLSEGRVESDPAAV